MILLAIYGMRVVQNSGIEIISDSISEDYDQNIKNQVDVVISLCNQINSRVVSCEISLEEGQKLAADQIRELRYGEAGYFWIDTYDGDNVVLLGGQSEGTNRLSAVDSEGFAMVKDFIEGAKKNVSEGYFNNYKFPKEGETESSPKRAYTKAFEPFKWVIGTGNYIDYIDTTVSEHDGALHALTRKVTVISLVVGFVLAILSVVFSVILMLQIVRPLRDTMNWLSIMEKGDFSVGILDKYANSSDDFGILMHDIEKMRIAVEKLLKAAKKDSEQVFDSSISLAKGVESTKDTSGNITLAVGEIATGATNQAESVQDGVNAISDILNNVDALTSEVETADEKASEMAES
jgi:methyl-accepting chemotaxis protein